MEHGRIRLRLLYRGNYLALITLPSHRMLRRGGARVSALPALRAFTRLEPLPSVLSHLLSEPTMDYSVEKRSVEAADYSLRLWVAYTNTIPSSGHKDNSMSSSRNHRTKDMCLWEWQFKVIEQLILMYQSDLHERTSVNAFDNIFYKLAQKHIT